MTISGYRVGYNTLDTPLVADNQGRVIAGRSYDLVLATSDPVRGAVARDALVLLPAGAEPSGGQADAELARFAVVEANAETLNAYGRQPLADVAETVGVDVSDGPNKAELVARLAVLDPLPDLPPLDGGEMVARPAAKNVEWMAPEPGQQVDHLPADLERSASAEQPAEPEDDETSKPAARRSTRKAR